MFSNYQYIRDTKPSRFNTCQHLGEDGNWDCDKRRYLSTHNPKLLCIEHFREEMRIYTDDYELNTLILEWRKILDA